jgi:NAD(P)-dependent dehydrogenase (short-subunit alcohol dehydrogenase family)
MIDEPGVHAWAAALEPVDHLIVTAASVVHGPFESSETGDVRGMIEAKFIGPYVTVREALPRMREGGSITLFAGVLSRRPGKGAVALGAVNAAVEGLVRGLALELGPTLRVNAVSPGMAGTEAYAGMPEERRAAMFRDTAARLPPQRIGTADEIAEATLTAATATFMIRTGNLASAKRFDRGADVFAGDMTAAEARRSMGLPSDP